MENNVYFSTLRKHLYGLSEEERDDVVSFYQEYAVDAKLSGETLINEFGTPKQLARRVLVDYSIKYDDAAEEEAVDCATGLRQRESSRVKRQLNLLWVVVIGLLTSIIWVPAALAVMLGLFLVIVAGVAVAIILLSLLAIGLFQIVGGFAVIGQSWQTSVLQIGLGITFVGIQIVAWPVGWLIVRTIFASLMKFVKFLGRRFSHSGGTQNGETI